MSNIIAINGSPKTKDSVSGMIISQIEGIVGVSITTYQATKLIRREDTTETLSDVLKADILLFVFPLYVDSLPAPLVKTLTLIERVIMAEDLPPKKVFAICNCGFLEAEHTRFALNIIENFCARAGMIWGYGVGIGSGGFIYSQRNNMSKGPAADVYSALCALGKSLQTGDDRKQNVFATAKMPRFLYSAAGNFGWRQMAKKYKTGKALMAKPHIANGGK